jgi:hypothetical protein
MYDTPQLATPEETAERVQLVAENVPGESEMKVTLPVGVVVAPPDVSVILAVQLDDWFTTVGLEQTIDVEVARELTVTLAIPLVLVP